MLRAALHNYIAFQKYEVMADNVEDFIQKFGKPSRYEERGSEYMECVLQSHTRQLFAYGYTFISNHDSKTGEIVSYYGRNKEVSQ